MPRRPHHVGAHDPALVDGSPHVGVGPASVQSEAEAPAGVAILLRLDGAEPSDKLLGILLVSPAAQTVISKSCVRDLTVHREGVEYPHFRRTRWRQ